MKLFPSPYSLAFEGFRYVDAKEGEVSQAAKGQAARQGVARVYSFLR
jgi:hypothetical protein